jgi:hypothetical protein
MKRRSIFRYDVLPFLTSDSSNCVADRKKEVIYISQSST